MPDSYTILIIDDEAMVRYTLTALLEEHGHKVMEASNGEEGVAIFNREKPDIVLTDIRMPKMDGFDVIRYIKEKDPDIPVIAITGVTDPSLVEEVIRKGAWNCLFKPITNSHLLTETIRQALAKPA